ncbi:MAG: MBL fold metallo-hydrolase [Polaromonas sp.]|nr:MBL fold metallo-hydrolase [Polaromonas sp.]
MLFLFFAGTYFGVTAQVNAEAPMLKKQGPGYYRMMLGDFEVTALLDGTLDLPVNRLLNHIEGPEVDKVLAAQSLKSPLETSYNAYLVNTGEKLVLIDTGAGNLLGPTLGNMLQNLKAAGYSPEQVDEVYLTHMHNDHMGGLMTGGQRAFPNAILRADKGDADHWFSAEEMEKARPGQKMFFTGAQASVSPYMKAGKFSAFEGNSMLAKGIRSVVTRGHTPGHSVYVVESKGQKMVILGDMMHVAAIQFERPVVGIQFDSDSNVASVQRASLYEQAANDQAIFAASHVSFPGLGRVRKNGTGYVWLPVNYSALR